MGGFNTEAQDAEWRDFKRARPLPDHRSGPSEVPGEDTATAHAEPRRTYPDVPPARISSDPNHPDFHPSFRRVGVAVNGVVRSDVHWADSNAGAFRSVHDGPDGQVHAGHAVDVFWRWEESRQERRARERWDAKHPRPRW